MPPFGSESKERDTSQPLSFLSFPRPRRQPGHTSPIFGAEPDESGSGCTDAESREPDPAPFTPFGAELDEDDPPPKRHRAVSATGPFGQEGAEDEDLTQPQAGSSSDEDGPGDSKYVIKSDSVFCLGWKSVLDAEKAGFWKTHMDDERASKAKRKYNNSNRKATAEYARQKTQGCYKKNGIDPLRLEKLFATAQCSCAWLAIMKDFQSGTCTLSPPFSSSTKSFIGLRGGLPRCQQDLLQPVPGVERASILPPKILELGQEGSRLCCNSICILLQLCCVSKNT